MPPETFTEKEPATIAADSRSIYSTPGRFFALKVRKYEIALDKQHRVTELDSRHIFETMKLRTDKTGLLLLDVWSGHDNAGWFERAEKNLHGEIVPLVRFARRHGIRIFHVPTTGNIHPAIGPEPEDIVIRGVQGRAEGPRDDNILMQYCHELGIDTILYAGWAVNMCMWNKDANIRTLSHTHGLRVILVRDATLAFESHESLEGEWFKKWGVFEVERRWGSTTTLPDLQQALQPAKAPARKTLPGETEKADQTPAGFENTEMNRKFHEWKAVNPTGTFAEFYVDYLSKVVLQGRKHNTLGKYRSDPERFEATGRIITGFAIHEAGLNHGSRVLDYGCGSLRVGRHLINYLDSGGYHGMDIRSTFYREGLATINAELLEKKKHTFSIITDRSIARVALKPPDCILSIAVLHHVPPAEVEDFARRISAMMGRETIALINYMDGDSIRQYDPRGWTYSKDFLRGTWASHGCHAEFIRCPELDEWYEGRNESDFIKVTKQAG